MWISFSHESQLSDLTESAACGVNGRAGAFGVAQYLDISEQEAEALSDHRPGYAVLLIRRVRHRFWDHARDSQMGLLGLGFTIPVASNMKME